MKCEFDAVSVRDDWKVTLLYVEDEKETRGIVTEMLSRYLPQLNVIPAENGLHGLELFERHQPEIVLTDVSMPGMNGIEMAHRIRSINSKVHIIAATALADNSLLLEAIKLGIRRYVLKPIDFRQLHEGISECLEQITLERRLKEQHELFRTLCDFAPIGIFRTDSAGNNLYCNPCWEEITGLRGEAGLGQGWLQAIHPEDRERHALAWLAAMDQQRTFSLEYRQSGQEQQVSWVRALAAPIRKEDGTVSGFVGTLEDITELHHARQEMLKSQKLESLSLLAGGIAHDFNNILTGILGNIGLAKYHLDDPHEMELRLKNAETATSRAKELTQQLLTFAKGGVPIKKVIALPNLLKEAVEFALHGSTALCRFQIDEELWRVSADEGQLVQVVHNLILNAVQSMPEGGTVQVTARNVEQGDKKQVQIAVSDTGVGIAEQHLHRIFDPYFTTKEKGSGLGLATCYSIIRKHDGTIRACSAPGEGACFEITLPATAQPCEVRDSSRSGLAHGSGSILVLDDEKDVRDVAKAILEELGYQVECAQDGAEAIQLFTRRQERGEPFTLVILDLTIPGGVGGKETMKRLRELDPSLKGMVCSGYSNDPVMADHQSYGFDAVLTKPYTLEEMNAALQALLGE